MSEYDEFGDILQRQTGIFGADTPAMEHALQKHDSADTVPLADGVHVTMDCRSCGRTRDVTIEWPEMACLSMNLDPSSVINGASHWVFTRQGWTPDRLYCSECMRAPDSELHPYVTQQEASGHIATGRANGFPYFRGQGQGRPSFYDTLVGHVKQSAQRG